MRVVIRYRQKNRFPIFPSIRFKYPSCSVIPCSGLLLSDHNNQRVSRQRVCLDNRILPRQAGASSGKPRPREPQEEDYSAEQLPHHQLGEGGSLGVHHCRRRLQARRLAPLQQVVSLDPVSRVNLLEDCSAKQRRHSHHKVHLCLGPLHQHQLPEMVACSGQPHLHQLGQDYSEQLLLHQRQVLEACLDRLLLPQLRELLEGCLDHQLRLQLLRGLREDCLDHQLHPLQPSLDYSAHSLQQLQRVCSEAAHQPRLSKEQAAGCLELLQPVAVQGPLEDCLGHRERPLRRLEQHQRLRAVCLAQLRLQHNPLMAAVYLVRQLLQQLNPPRPLAGYSVQPLPLQGLVQMGEDFSVQPLPLQGLAQMGEDFSVQPLPLQVLAQVEGYSVQPRQPQVQEPLEDYSVQPLPLQGLAQVEEDSSDRPQVVRRQHRVRQPLQVDWLKQRPTCWNIVQLMSCWRIGKIGSHNKQQYSKNSQQMWSLWISSLFNQQGG